MNGLEKGEEKEEEEEEKRGGGGGEKRLFVRRDNGTTLRHFNCPSTVEGVVPGGKRVQGQFNSDQSNAQSAQTELDQGFFLSGKIVYACSQRDSSETTVSIFI